MRKKKNWKLFPRISIKPKFLSSISTIRTEDFKVEHLIAKILNMWVSKPHTYSQRYIRPLRYEIENFLISTAEEIPRVGGVNKNKRSFTLNDGANQKATWNRMIICKYETLERQRTRKKDKQMW